MDVSIPNPQNLVMTRVYANVRVMEKNGNATIRNATKIFRMVAGVTANAVASIRGRPVIPGNAITTFAMTSIPVIVKATIDGLHGVCKAV